MLGWREVGKGLVGSAVIVVAGGAIDAAPQLPDLRGQVVAAWNSQRQADWFRPTAPLG